MSIMKKVFVLSLLLTAPWYKSLADTNDIFGIPPEMWRIKNTEDRVRFLETNLCPIHTEMITRKGETSCQVNYRGHTNMVVYVPIPEQEFDAKLFSMTGQEIPKARHCKFGQTLQPDEALLAGQLSYQDDVIRGHDRRLDFKNGNCSHFWEFDVLKSFKIKKSGVYRLQVQVRLFTKDTNGVFQPFLLPPVEAKKNISESDLNK